MLSIMLNRANLLPTVYAETEKKLVKPSELDIYYKPPEPEVADSNTESQSVIRRNVSAVRQSISDKFPGLLTTHEKLQNTYSFIGDKITGLYQETISDPFFLLSPGAIVLAAGAGAVVAGKGKKPLKRTLCALGFGVTAAAVVNPTRALEIATTGYYHTASLPSAISLWWNRNETITEKVLNDESREILEEKISDEASESNVIDDTVVESESDIAVQGETMDDIISEKVVPLEIESVVVSENVDLDSPTIVEHSPEIILSDLEKELPEAVSATETSDINDESDNTIKIQQVEPRLAELVLDEELVMIDEPTKDLEGIEIVVNPIDENLDNCVDTPYAPKEVPDAESKQLPVESEFIDATLVAHADSPPQSEDVILEKSTEAMQNEVQFADTEPEIIIVEATSPEAGATVIEAGEDVSVVDETIKSSAEPDVAIISEDTSDDVVEVKSASLAPLSEDKSIKIVEKPVIPDECETSIKSETFLGESNESLEDTVVPDVLTALAVDEIPEVSIVDVPEKPSDSIVISDVVNVSSAVEASTNVVEEKPTEPLNDSALDEVATDQKIEELSAEAALPVSEEKSSVSIVASDVVNVLSADEVSTEVMDEKPTESLNNDILGEVVTDSKSEELSTEAALLTVVENVNDGSVVGEVNVEIIADIETNDLQIGQNNVKEEKEDFKMSSKIGSLGDISSDEHVEESNEEAKSLINDIP